MTIRCCDHCLEPKELEPVTIIRGTKRTISSLCKECGNVWDDMNRIFHIGGHFDSPILPKSGAA
jgi:uncharacterized Zn finger protein